MQEKNSYQITSKFILRSDTLIGKQIVPLHDLQAVAGISSQFVNPNAAIDEIEIYDIPLCDGAMHVVGDSMYPLLSHGDTILYKTTQSRRGGLFFGQIYLLAFDLDGEEHIVIKYVFESEERGYYRLESANPRHKPMDIPRDSVRKMAIVKASIRHHALK